MKTTLDIPDDLFRQAKSQAALRGAKLKDLVADGLRLVLAGERARTRPKRVLFPIIKARPGAPVITKLMVDNEEEQTLNDEAKPN